MYYLILLLFVIGLYTGCDALTAPNDTNPANEKLTTQFVIFSDSAATDKHIAPLIKENMIQKAQINYRYKNKGISGFSADLSKKQVNRINSKKYVISKSMIPGDIYHRFWWSI